MNKTKKLVLLIAFCVTTIFYGQRKQEHEKIKTLKIAFVTEKLNLSSSEAESFWPIYNEYQEKRDALRHKERTQIRAKIKEADALTEKEADALLVKYLQFEAEEEILDKDFLEKISKVISSKKTLLLLRSEEEFKRQLIKQYRQKRGGGGGFR